VSQSPVAGESTPLHSAVGITIASLDRSSSRSAGEGQGAVAGILQNASLALGRVVNQPDLTPVDIVLKHDPSPGVAVAHGSSVNVSVASPLMTRVPDLGGKTLDYAKEALTAADGRRSKIPPPSSA